LSPRSVGGRSHCLLKVQVSNSFGFSAAVDHSLSARLEQELRARCKAVVDAMNDEVDLSRCAAAIWFAVAHRSGDYAGTRPCGSAWGDRSGVMTKGSRTTLSGNTLGNERIDSPRGLRWRSQLEQAGVCVSSEVEAVVDKTRLSGRFLNRNVAEYAALRQKVEGPETEIPEYFNMNVLATGSLCGRPSSERVAPNRCRLLVVGAIGVSISHERSRMASRSLYAKAR